MTFSSVLWFFCFRCQRRSDPTTLPPSQQPKRPEQLLFKSRTLVIVFTGPIDRQPSHIHPEAREKVIGSFHRYTLLLPGIQDDYFQSPPSQSFPAPRSKSNPNFVKVPKTPRANKNLTNQKSLPFSPPSLRFDSLFTWLKPWPLVARTRALGSPTQADQLFPASSQWKHRDDVHAAAHAPICGYAPAP